MSIELRRTVPQTNSRVPSLRSVRLALARGSLWPRVMRVAQAIETLCWCATVEHEVKCPFGWVVAERGRLYDGLYDSRHARRAPAPPSARVRLLNPAYTEEDPIGRRFALLEID